MGGSDEHRPNGYGICRRNGPDQLGLMVAAPSVLAFAYRFRGHKFIASFYYWDMSSRQYSKKDWRATRPGLQMRTILILMVTLFQAQLPAPVVQWVASAIATGCGERGYGWCKLALYFKPHQCFYPAV